jgi:cation transport regulator ChaC
VSADQIGAAPGKTLLFQYGSNMAETVLRSKIERHVAEFAPAGTPAHLRLLGLARLDGWRFTLGLFGAQGGHRVADIVESSDGGGVWGALYKLPVELVRRSDGERSVLDRIEGHRTSQDPENYVPLRVAVHLGDAQAEAWTYVGRHDARERCARDHGDAHVSEMYADSIISGARALAVPASYLEELQEILAEHS